ncbi:PucR family transcriptional regulator [Leucobacter sp. gxy201]|uniref:PucR family transcriptional regulator n=1 Tax=Leucobacter sp. gxy201 TaxID=2957200 RepID=UPI003DA06CD3
MQNRLRVDDVLSLPELSAGDPELVAGSAGLDRPVRWAHVVAGMSAFPLLDGGELLLATGAGWPTDAASLDALTEEFVGSGPAGLILELGQYFSAAPRQLVAACRAHAIPLIVLHRPVRFVQITQRVHQRVLEAQTEALAARAEVHAMLTELGLNRSPVDYVIERLSKTLDAPVVLEDSSGQVVSWSARDADPEVVLAPWAAGARPGFGPREEALPAGSASVPVEAQGKRWGRLSSLPGPAHPAGRRTVLELGAFALALGRLADTEGDQWLRLGSKQLFDILLSGRYRRDSELAVQLTAAGLPIEGRRLVGATLRGAGDFGAHSSLERAVLETALRRAVAPEGRAILMPDSSDPGTGATVGFDRSPPLLALLSFPEGDPRVAPALGSHPTPPLAARLAREIDMLLPSTTPAPWRAHLALGSIGSGLRSLVASLERVRAAGMLDPSATVGRVTVQQAEQQALAYLVRRISSMPDVQEFAHDALGPLIEHDAAAGPGHSGDLLVVLRAYLEQPTNRSLAAQRARLSRSVFYQRLALIEDLLSVDLADGTVIATLTVALLARG